jgi:hypothetical protein
VVVRATAAGFALGLMGLGCLVPAQPAWDARVEPEQVDAACQGLPAKARSNLMPLTKVFYGRITSRRFNSRATFEDPSVRQFFPTVAAYSDYYAALADALDQADIENNRPLVVELLSITRNESGSLRIEVRFIGENDLPLRWWSASLTRADEWRWQDDRWWVVPGKV